MKNMSCGGLVILILLSPILIPLVWGSFIAIPVGVVIAGVLIYAKQAISNIKEGVCVIASWIVLIGLLLGPTTLLIMHLPISYHSQQTLFSIIYWPWGAAALIWFVRSMIKGRLC